MSPNVQPASLVPSPTTPAAFMPGPELQFPQVSVLPRPSETQALGWPAFLRGLAYITGTVGMLPVTVYRGTDAVDPQPAVIRQPDPNQTPMAFWAAAAASLVLYGNAISIITSRDRYGFPLTLKPIHPTLAAVRFTGNPMAPEIDSWYVAGQLYDQGDIWHVKSHLGRAGWPLGRGVMDVDADSIALGMAMQSYAASYFSSGAMPTGIVKIHRPEITQQQAEDAKAAWVARYAGVNSQIAVLNELTDFQPIAWKPVDSQMIESRQFSLVDAAQMFGLPPSKLGANVGGGTYKNAEMEEIQARNDAIAPWTNLLAQAVSIDLLPRGQMVTWDLSASMRTDTLSQYQAYQTALGGPGPTSQWLLVDEIRARENLDPMDQVADELGVASPLADPTDTAEGAPPMPPDAVTGGPPASNTFPGFPETTNKGAPGVPEPPETAAAGAAGNPKGVGH
jgi:HK97 family phage portal protein